MSGFKSISTELRRGLVAVITAEDSEAAKHAYASLKTTVEKALVLASATTSGRDKIRAEALAADARRALRSATTALALRDRGDEMDEEPEEKKVPRRRFSFGMSKKAFGTVTIAIATAAATATTAIMKGK